MVSISDPQMVLLQDPDFTLDIKWRSTTVKTNQTCLKKTSIYQNCTGPKIFKIDNGLIGRYSSFQYFSFWLFQGVRNANFLAAVCVQRRNSFCCFHSFTSSSQVLSRKIPSNNECI